MSRLPNHQFIFKDVDTLDITNPSEVKKFFQENKPEYCVNCAAYTAVDKAETEPEQARRINALGAGNLAEACKEYGAVMIQISTDFVFDGNNTKPYGTQDPTNPLGVYGMTKLQGEQAVAAAVEEHFIIRTSWLYSEFGNNFLKTMLNLGTERPELKIVNDQYGSPTYAGDLAEFILYLIKNGQTKYGLYHYSNEGCTSWYDLAREIFRLRGMTVRTLPIPSDEFKSRAERPKYSKLDLSRTLRAFSVNIPHWESSLDKCLSKMSKG